MFKLTNTFIHIEPMSKQLGSPFFLQVTFSYGALYQTVISACNKKRVGCIRGITKWVSSQFK